MRKLIIEKNFVIAGHHRHPIFVSSGALKGKNSSDRLVEIFQKESIPNLELSSGLKMNKFENLINNNLNYMLHNYFPLPKKNFVLNLATNDEISKKFIKKSIILSSKLSSKIYGIHAGYVSNFFPSDLGNVSSQSLLVKPTKKDYEIAEKTFIKNVNEVIEFAKKFKVKILIENNGISKNTISNNELIPRSLLVKPSDVKRLSKKIHNFKILFDVAHAKISARSYNFNPEELLYISKDFIKCFHLSDNNSYFDTNDKILENSWFVDGVKKILINSKYPIPLVIEVYNLRIQEIKNQIELVKNLFSN